MHRIEMNAHHSNPLLFLILTIRHFSLRRFLADDGVVTAIVGYDDSVETGALFIKTKCRLSADIRALRQRHSGNSRGLTSHTSHAFSEVEVCWAG